MEEIKGGEKIPFLSIILSLYIEETLNEYIYIFYCIK